MSRIPRFMIFAMLAAAVSRMAGAQEQKPPMFETKRVEGTDNVYVFRYQNSQSMFVVTPDGVIATDPIGLARPQAVSTYIEEIRRVTPAPVRYVVYSHQHFDHIAGGKVFGDLGATFVAHERTRDWLRKFNHPDVIMPDEVFGDRGRTISLGGTTLELHYVGRNHFRQHARHAAAQGKDHLHGGLDPDRRGARFGNGRFLSARIRGFAEGSLAMDWEPLIPGHPGQPGGRLGTKQDVEDLIVLLQEASAEVKKAADAGKCWADAEKEVTLAKYSTWPGYQNRRFLIQRYCALWGRGF